MPIKAAKNGHVTDMIGRIKILLKYIFVGSAPGLM